MNWTTEALRREFSYDAETGVMTRRIGIPGHSAGATVGTLHRTGYIVTKGIAVHRLIWQLVHGYSAPAFIDHINGNRSDNRLANLRLATNSQNQANRKLAPGRGTTWNKSCRKWQAQIKVNQLSIYLGVFRTRAEAQEAYFTASKAYFGDYARSS